MNKRFVSFDWVIKHKLRDNDNSYVSGKNIKHIVNDVLNRVFKFYLKMRKKTVKY